MCFIFWLKDRQCYYQKESGMNRGRGRSDCFCENILVVVYSLFLMPEAIDKKTEEKTFERNSVETTGYGN
jgi:hypothetical protein